MVLMYRWWSVLAVVWEWTLVWRVETLNEHPPLFRFVVYVWHHCMLLIGPIPDPVLGLPHTFCHGLGLYPWSAWGSHKTWLQIANEIHFLITYYVSQEVELWLWSTKVKSEEQLSVTNLSSENNLLMFWLNAPVVIQAKMKKCEQTLPLPCTTDTHHWRSKFCEDCSSLPAFSSQWATNPGLLSLSW